MFQYQYQYQYQYQFQFQFQYQYQFHSSVPGTHCVPPGTVACGRYRSTPAAERTSVDTNGGCLSRTFAVS